MAKLENIDFNLLYEDWKQTHYKICNNVFMRESRGIEAWNEFYTRHNIDVGQRKHVEAILLDIDMISY